MADSEAFSLICVALEERTPFSRIEARGTVRLALKSSGLSADSVTAKQMKVVVEVVFPKELTNRGIEDPGDVCRALSISLDGVFSESPHDDTPESIFRRLSGS